MKKYVFKAYSEIFPTLFNKEKKRIAPHLPKALFIEHIGSTAVPGLGGKGIIDIAIAVNRNDMDETSSSLQGLGYEFRQDFSTNERMFFVGFLEDTNEESRRYHIHLTYPENEEWKDFLSFRDYLINHPQEASDYAKIKRNAALEVHQDGEKYRKAKEPIIKKIIRMRDT